MHREMFNTLAGLAALVVVATSAIFTHNWYFSESSAVVPVVAGWRSELAGSLHSYNPAFMAVGQWYPEDQPSPWEPPERRSASDETMHVTALIDWEKVTPNWYFLRRAAEGE